MRGVGEAVGIVPGSRLGKVDGSTEIESDRHRTNPTGNEVRAAATIDNRRPIPIELHICQFLRENTTLLEEREIPSRQ